MKINFFENKLIFPEAAKLVKKSIDELNKKYIVLGLCGGRSINSILQALKKENIEWDKIHIFMVDERLVPLDDKKSNFKLIKESLVNVIPKKNLHPFDFNKKDEIIIDPKTCETKTKGLFAAGDVTDVLWAQIVIAAGEGAKAALAAYDYIQGIK